METLSTCEYPEYPTWMWRYNRNKHLTRFEPWTTRFERWPPQYRHMGMHLDFQFRDGLPPLGFEPRLLEPVRLGVNFAHALKHSREVGSGNGALGNSHGPAPPVLFVSKAGETILDNQENTDITKLPLDPPHYMMETMHQGVSYPGTFPNFTVHPGHTGPRVERPPCCIEGPVQWRKPLVVWQEKHLRDLENIAKERAQDCHRTRDCAFYHSRMQHVFSGQDLNPGPPQCGPGIRKCIDACRTGNPC